MKSILALLAALTIAACSPQTESTHSGASKAGTMPDLDGSFDFSGLEIVNNDGESLRFDVYLAKEGTQWRRGLMFVRNMPARTGMLFIYDEDDVRSMWMKNTYIPLDIVFALSDGSISSVIHDTVPLNLTSLSSNTPVRYVLELNAGTARELGIGQKSTLRLDQD